MVDQLVSEEQVSGSGAQEIRVEGGSESMEMGNEDPKEVALGTESHQYQWCLLHTCYGLIDAVHLFSIYI